MDNVHPKLRPTTLDFSEGAVCWGLCPFLIGHLPNHVDELGWFPTNHSTRGITSRRHHDAAPQPRLRRSRVGVVVM